MNTPNVSVLIPVFNVEKYLRQCLDSVVNQTLKDIEIICINDGSTDSSLKIIKEYARRDPRIVVINKKNTGYGDSMNKGIDKARGEYIGIIESDDFADSEMFEFLYMKAIKNRTEIAKSNYFRHYSALSRHSPLWSNEHQGVYDARTHEYIDTNDIFIQTIKPKEDDTVISPNVYKSILDKDYAIWSAIYDREFINKNGIRFLSTPGASYQDTGFFVKSLLCAERIYLTNRAFLHYRQDNEASSVNNPSKVYCVNEEFAEIEDFIKKRNLTLAQRGYVQKIKYRSYTWNYNRLTTPLDIEFLEQFSKEFKEASDKRFISWGLFNINQQQNLLEIINDPKLFHQRKLARQKAKVSVVVPIYNVEKYLDKCLTQLRNQTFKDIEIICIDDGSTDGSINIVERHYNEDCRITLHTQKNSGLSAARNKGISLANSKFIMFCDSDDYLETNSIQDIYSVFEKNPKVNLVEFGMLNIYETAFSKYLHRKADLNINLGLKFSGKQNVSAEILENTLVSACTKVFRMSIIQKYHILFPDKLWYEDNYFTIVYRLLAKTLFYLDKPLYIRTRRDNSIMSITESTHPRSLERIDIVSKLFEQMVIYGLLPEYSDYITKKFISSVEKTKRTTPKQVHPQILIKLRDFIDNNSKDLKNTTPNLYNQIMGLLPPQINIGDNNRRAIFRRILLKTSIRYRREQYIIDRINQLEKKLERLSTK